MDSVWNHPVATPTQPTASIVFTFGATIDIDARPADVFDVIAAFSRYSTWNTWTPTLTFECADDDVAIGAKGRLRANQDGTIHNVPIEVCTPASQSRAELTWQIIALERSEDEYKICWVSSVLPQWLLKAERVQTVTMVDDGTCRVRSWESMSGPAAYMFKLFGLPRQLERLNARYLEELKRVVGSEAAA